MASRITGFIYIWLLSLVLAVSIVAQEESQTISVTVSPSRVGWQDTRIPLEAGDIFDITVNGTINIWPNCEETKADAGFPDLDCTNVTQIGPNGTTVFSPAEADYPYPGGNIAGLVARIGENQPFLVGTGGTFTAEFDGTLQFAINDVQYMEDNQGQWVAFVTLPEPIILPSTNGEWIDTGVVLEAGQAYTISASGTVNIWPNCEETKAEQGYPDIDCAIVTQMGPNGVGVFDPADDDYPLAGAQVGALVGQIAGGAVFLIGEGGTFIADASGPLYVTVNDTNQFTVDDQGFFNVVILIEPAGDESISIPATNADWQTTGITLDAGESITISASGMINIFPNCELEREAQNMADFDCTLAQMGPNGTDAIELTDDTYPLAGTRVGALIARFGEDGTPFFVGTGGTYTPENGGELQFRVNQIADIDDNTGAFVVIINPEQTAP